MFEGMSERTLALFAQMKKDATTFGIATNSGVQFYYLEETAKQTYPVFYPILSETPRVYPMYNGVRVGGPGVNWKQIVGVDVSGYPAVSEGHRNAYTAVSEKDAYAPYAYLGKDASATFQAYSQALGFDDALKIAQFTNLNALLNGEEKMIMFGNPGNGSVNGYGGYVLGQCPQPSGLQSASTGTYASGTYYVYCVALTPWGVAMATSTGCAIPVQRVNADGSKDAINGGTSQISAASSGVSLDGSHGIDVKVAPVNGAVGYAWYIGKSNAAGAKFNGVTALCMATFTAPLTGSLQTAADAGLAADASYNLLDFPGALTWHFQTYGATNGFTAYLKDITGTAGTPTGFTSNGDGTIKEFEDVADYLWINFKASIDKIWLGGALIQSASRAILTSASGPGAQRLIIDRDSDGKIIGGQIVSEYHWKYSSTTAKKTVPVSAHPWLPDGTVWFDITTNPYPAAGQSIPAVRRIVTLEDHFSVKWPYRNLTHEIGIYAFITQQHYLPWCGAVLTGVANKVN